ncbi:MAG TPA: helicase-related protein [Pyrinomonadaceae bacterium]|nr:helicase-related protein [Pyrinomonadaceae bacterium]
MKPGSIVRCRNREWVLLPYSDSCRKNYRLRPLTGTVDDAIEVNREISKLVGYVIPSERLEPAAFPLPTENDISNAIRANLLWHAARLTLREGASPMRSLGRISIRPRVYQFVPLLMALRQNPVRLLIADDVGVGKTIEALLIARELWERGEIKRICVLCPPYLCDQWKEELTQKFNLDAVIIRPGTLGQLERDKPANRSVYEHYPVHVVSIDWVKSERNRAQFLQFCPEFVIVDEAHGAAPANIQVQQERYNLVKALSEKPERHLILLTATPHSGVPETFRSLLSFLRKEFEQWDMSNLSNKQYEELAKHFVLRTRENILKEWEGEHCFPERERKDEVYSLSPEYKQLYQKVFDYCKSIILEGEKQNNHNQRIRYWNALSLLRCVMSSPDAALAALQKRSKESLDETDETYLADLAGRTLDSNEDISDEIAANLSSLDNKQVAQSDSKKLRELIKLAQHVRENNKDTKATNCLKLIKKLLKDGFAPIIWCHFVTTAEYLAEFIREAIPDAQVVCVTGRQSDDERKERINQIDVQKQRILVATDCLSEGINLQNIFTAAIHYDLPWNPNRLEQREGRIDRYGQSASKVITYRYYSSDNAVDGVVIDVLLNKAREIRKTLGTHVPVPQESENVLQVILKAVFLRGEISRNPVQLSLGFELDEVKDFHNQLDSLVKSEKNLRDRFAQIAIKPNEVRQELEAADKVLGDPDAVREFVISSLKSMQIGIDPIEKRKDVYCINTNEIHTHDQLSFYVPEGHNGKWFISFVSPTPEGAEYLGRNHPFVAALARLLLEDALYKHGEAYVSRCGVIRTKSVSNQTYLLLLRCRYLIMISTNESVLSEEVLVLGFVDQKSKHLKWLKEDEALILLKDARASSNISTQDKKEFITKALSLWPQIQADLEKYIKERAEELAKAHKRIRRAANLNIDKLEVQPQFPPDLLGIFVLLPH